jgi:exodeoxyribonuclease-5
MQIELTPEQKEIQHHILSWVDHCNTPYIAVSGYAGTGKTTVIGDTARKLVDNYPTWNIRFLTFTGKASMVLAHKLAAFGLPLNGINVSCSTIHSYVYSYLGLNKSYEPEFERKTGETIEGGDLLIIDEASMLSEKIFKDLAALGRPMLFVGDPGQLPPINGKMFTPLLTTDLQLKIVHRQAEENPIIQLATDTRNMIPIKPGVYNGKVAKLPLRSTNGLKAFESFQKQVGEEDTVILCGKNVTRTRLNTRVRYTQGLLDFKPISGERLVCLKNDPEKNLFNGQCVVVEKAEQIIMENIPDNIGMHLLIRPEGSAQTIECLAYTKAFNNAKPAQMNKMFGQDKKFIEQIQKKYPTLKDMNIFDYGYALSVHKSQGSEWNRVALQDERTSYQTDEEYFKWLYTGITRAKDKLLILY